MRDIKSNLLWALLVLSIFFTNCEKDDNNDVIVDLNEINVSIQEKTETMYNDLVSIHEDFHKYPELARVEIRTAEKIEKYLTNLGIEVTSNIGGYGVVGILKGKKPGKTIAWRADIDALPNDDLNFPDPVTYASTFEGVRHTCGHDANTTIALGIANVLSGIKEKLKGEVVFVFQPAEEGAPPGEEGGAKLMLKEGLFDNPKPEVVFGLHISSSVEVGKISYKPGGLLAAADRFEIKVHGQQTHGSSPWFGVDPIVTSAQIILGLQTIVSRQMELTKEPAVITVGKIEAGVRNNIIPEEATMIGTIRTLDPDMRKDIHNRIRKTATLIAESQGATAEVDIKIGTPVTQNNLELTRKMIPSLFNAAGEENVIVQRPITGAEDFAYYANEVPSLFFFLGGRSSSIELKDAPSHHTPDFYIDESGFKTGVKALTQLTLDYMASGGK